MKTHELKTDPEVFDSVVDGRKKFEIRYDDRGYNVGDLLLLKRTKHSAAQMANGAPLEFTGETHSFKVNYILKGPTYGLEEGWVILS